MSEQSSTTTNIPAEPLLCEMGCGFFGNPATGNCCSKCWREAQKKKGNVESSNNVAVSSSPTPMEVDAPAAPQPTDAEASAIPAAPVVDKSVESAPKAVKKKKKKTSYKSMMASMTKRTKDDSDIQKEKEGLRKVTGGGTFSKVDKI